MKSILRLISSFGILILILLVPNVGHSNPNDIPHSVLTNQASTVLSVAFNPKKSNILACGLSDGRIQVWDTSKHTLQYILYEYKDLIFSLAFSPDGRTLASGNADGTLRLWDVDTGKRRILLTEHTDIVTSLTFSADGSTLASGSADGTIRLWNPDGEQKKVLQGYEVSVSSLAFSPTDNILVTGRADNIIRVWDLGIGTLRHILLGHEGPVISLAFSLDGSTLASGSADTTVRLWDMTKDKTAKTLTAHETLTEHTDWVNSVAFNSTLLASGSHDKTIRLWDANTGEHQHTLTAHTGSVESVAFNTGVAFNADGNTLASGSADGRVLLWKLAPAPDAPDLVVESVTANKITLDPGETFTLTATLKNRGIGKAEAPIYYRWHRSTHPNIHKMGGSDKVLTGAREEIGEKRTAVRSIVEFKKTEDVSLGTNQSSEQYIALTAPQEPDTYYYSVCVESPPNESDNCSADVEITVQSPVVNIPDLNLRTVIETELDKNPGATITATDMQTITGLSAEHENIRNLTGLEFAINLEELDLSNNQISDVTLLAGLRKLKELDLSDNSTAKGKSITNLTGLELAINLEKLDLSNNQISDVTPLKNLKNLEELDLSNNQISDVTPLKDLKNLEKLDLSYNSIEDPLYLASLENLTTLDISENPIKFDVGLLTSKKNLKLDLTPYETTNVFGLTIYYDSNGNKTVLIKGLKLDNPKFNDSNLDYTDYLPPEQGNHFEIYEQDGNTCGHYSALMLLHYYGVKFNTLKLGTKSGEKLGEETFGKLSSFFAMDSLLPGQTRNEMKRGLSQSLPVDIEHFSADEYSSTQNPDDVLRDMVSQSRPPILLIRLGDINLHYVIAVGYDTETDKFLIADPNGYFYWLNYYTRTDNIPISGSPNKKTCRPALKEAWGLESEVQASCDIDGESFWKLGAPLGDFADFFESDYQMFVPKEAPSYHHLKSETYYIKEEGKRARNPFTKSDFKVEFDDDDGGKVEHCAQFFVKKDGADVFVKCEPGDNKVVVSGTIENGWVNINDIGIGMVEMFLTVYYESSGGATHSAPSIALSVPSITTTLLPNYPNPFNPETWIPYQLSEPADVRLTIYDIQGHVVRNLDLGHQRAGMYHNRSRAAHWDGRNAQGESVASGVYFYTLTTGEFSATRKMLIRK